VRIIVHNCHTQHSTEQFSENSHYLLSYPPDKHQSSDSVYWIGEGVSSSMFVYVCARACVQLVGHMDCLPKSYQWCTKIYQSNQPKAFKCNN